MPSQKSVGTAITIMLCLVMAVVTMSHVEASGTWSPTGSMSTSRYYHTATLLPDGRVLVSGGSSGRLQRVGKRGNLRSGAGHLVADRLDEHGAVATRPRCCKTAGCSSAAVSDGSAIGQRGNLRSGAGHLVADGLDEHGPLHHTATLLPDGRVLVSGGYPTAHALGSAEIYDPALGTWSPTDFDEHGARRPHGHAAARRPGARQRGAIQLDTIDTSASAEIYDPALGTWSQTGSMTAERAMHTAMLLLDGQVLVSGGSAITITTLATAVL